MKTFIKTAIVLVTVLAAINVSAQPPQGRGERQQATPEERAKQRTEQLTKELGLNDTQQTQVYDLQLKMVQSMEKMRAQGQRGQQPDREKMMAEMEKHRNEMSAEMKKILTEEQFAKWEKQQAETRGNQRGRRGQDARPLQQ